jgi:hypothetical protein
MSKSLCDYHDDWYEMADCAFHEPHERSNMGRRCEFWNMETGECGNQERMFWLNLVVESKKVHGKWKLENGKWKENSDESS